MIQQMLEPCALPSTAPSTAGASGDFRFRMSERRARQRPERVRNRPLGSRNAGDPTRSVGRRRRAALLAYFLGRREVSRQKPAQPAAKPISGYPAGTPKGGRISRRSRRRNRFSVKLAKLHDIRCHSERRNRWCLEKTNHSTPGNRKPKSPVNIPSTDDAE